MRFTSSAFLGLTLVALILGACTQRQTSIPESPVTGESSSSVGPVQVVYEGALQRIDISIYMEGTHQLETDVDGMFLLRSTTIDLDQHSGRRVLVQGLAQPTVEAGGTIIDVTAISDIEPESTQSSVQSPPELVVSSEDDQAESSPAAAQQSSPVAVRSSVAPSSRASSVASSIVAVSASSTATSADADLDGKVALMAKAKVDATTFTQVFCSRHVGFCVPIHKSWYYNSFGATSSYLWHVEVSSEAVLELGDGPLIVNLVSGALDPSIPDKSVEAGGNFVIGYRAWTNNRHFEISAPTALQGAVAYMIEALSSYQTDSTSSGMASAPQSSSSSSHSL